MKNAAALFMALSMLFLPESERHTSSDTSILEITLEADEECDLCETEISVHDLKEGTETLFPVNEKTAEIELKKGNEYLIHAENIPDGWIVNEEILITKQQSRTDSKRTITIHPFEVRIFQYVRETKLFAEGGVLELKDESDEVLVEFVPDEEGFVRNEEDELFAFPSSRSLILSQKEPVEGFEEGADLLITFPDVMKEEDGPFEIEYYLDEAGSIDDVTEPEGPVPYYEFWHIPPREPEEPLITEELTEEEETEAEVLSVSEEESGPVLTSFVIPEIYLPAEEKKPSAKIETKVQKCGFIVRLVNEEGNYVSGALISVFDVSGSIVDSWRTGNEDHLVQNEKIKADQTYRIHLSEAAEGYAAAVPDIEHTAVSRTDQNYPLIELSDRLKKQSAQAAEQPAEEKKEPEKKKVNIPLIASIGAGVGLLAVGGGILFLKFRH